MYMHGLVKKFVQRDRTLDGYSLIRLILVTIPTFRGKFQVKSGKIPICIGKYISVVHFLSLAFLHFRIVDNNGIIC